MGPAASWTARPQTVVGSICSTIVAAGDYTVALDISNFDSGAVLDGYVQSTDQSDSSSDGANRMDPWAVALGAGEDYILADFGYYIQSVGGQGCTPGYWKQPHHFDDWVTYTQGDLYNTVFGVSYNKTLLSALKAGGGGEKALGRHATAALLNAANANVNYAFTEAQIITMVQDAYANGTFEATKNTPGRPEREWLWFIVCNLYGSRDVSRCVSLWDKMPG